MKIINPGHTYALESFEGSPDQLISFINKKRTGDTLQTVHDGTTNEELLRVLIDRMEWLNDLLPCTENQTVIVNLKASLELLEECTKKRLARGVEGTPKA